MKTGFARPGPQFQFREMRDFAVRELPLEIRHLPPELDGFRILHISDLHLTPKWHPAYCLAIDAVAEMDVDVVLCTGDIVDNRRTHLPAMPQVMRFLPALKSRLGTYSILGNHDNKRLAREMADLGVKMLDGTRVELAQGASTIELIGTPGIHRKDLPVDFATGFHSPVRGVPRILMAHFPDFFPKLESLQPDIYLCGHTHGGQVCLPGGWPILRHDSSRRALCRGYHKRGRTHYIVNHGFGCSMWNIRLFCPGELVLITLRAGQ